MLTRMSTFLFVLCLVFLAVPAVVSAQIGAASGSYKFIFEDEAVKAFEFDAKNDDRGTTTGSLFFTDETKTFYIDVDGTGEPPKDEQGPFFMKADFNAMTIEKNRAVSMGLSETRVTAVTSASSCNWSLKTTMGLKYRTNLSGPFASRFRVGGYLWTRKTPRIRVPS
jgi:hypothetical protein